MCVHHLSNRRYDDWPDRARGKVGIGVDDGADLQVHCFAIRGIDEPNRPVFVLAGGVLPAEEACRDFRGPDRRA